MKFNGNEFKADKDASVLDVLLDNRQDVGFSCKSGTCQSCLLKMDKGQIVEKAQKGLKSSAISQDYFLACQQPSLNSEEISAIDAALLFNHAHLIDKKIINEQVCLLILEPTTELYYHAGQFINLKNPDGVVRSYSLASAPTCDKYLHLHVRKKENGIMSHWLFEQFNIGDVIEFQGAIGDCFYHDVDKQKDMILVGSGTGAAPLLGIATDALNSQHLGDIRFYHGARDMSGLYLHDELTALAQQHNNFFYHACLSGNSAKIEGANIQKGRCNDIALAQIKIKNQPLLFLCGNPDMVKNTQRNAYLDGLSMDNIFIDPFEYQDLRKNTR